MTKTEKQDLDELGLTEEQLEERRAKLAAITGELPAPLAAHVDTLPTAKAPKKKRSDAGTKRTKAPEPQPQASAGVLTREQVARLQDLIISKERRAAESQIAADQAVAREDAFVFASEELKNFIAELGGATGIHICKSRQSRAQEPAE